VRLTLWLLGTEILTISTDRADPTEADGIEITRHAGTFDIGFQSAPPASWLSDIEARLKRHPPGTRR
jgi:hypothetical protein